MAARVGQTADTILKPWSWRLLCCVLLGACFTQGLSTEGDCMAIEKYGEYLACEATTRSLAVNAVYVSFVYRCECAVLTVLHCL